MHRKVYLAIRTYHSILLSCQGHSTLYEANSSIKKTTATAIYFVYTSCEALIDIWGMLFLIFTTITAGKYHGPCSTSTFTEKHKKDCGG